MDGGEDLSSVDAVRTIPAGNKRPLQVFIAARYSRKDEMSEIAKRIRATGAEVCTDWFDELLSADVELPDITPEFAESVANRDMNAMRRADIIISFTEDPMQPWKRGGRHVEFGFGLALGIPLWTVGPRETIYHYLPWVESFDTVEAMLGALSLEVQSWATQSC